MEEGWFLSGERPMLIVLVLVLLLLPSEPVTLSAALPMFTFPAGLLKFGLELGTVAEIWVWGCACVCACGRCATAAVLIVALLSSPSAFGRQ